MSAGKCILIVDDSRLSRIMISTIIRESDDSWTILQAGNGQEAVEQAQNNQIDLITLDMNMPVMDGLEAAPLLRNLQPEAKIVLLTANIQSATRDKVEEYKLEFVPKPITPEKILALVP